MPGRRRFSDELRSRVLRAMLSYAIFRLESAVTIAMTIVLVFLLPTPFPWWRWWYWLILGGVAEALIIYTSLTDPETGAQVVAAMFREEFNPRRIRSPRFRERVEKALEYQQRIEAAVRQRRGVLRDHLRDTTRQITDWIAAIYHLAQRLDTYTRDKIVKRDLKSLPSEIENLKKRLAVEDDEAVREQLRETVARKEQQLAYLRRLENTMEKAEFQLEATLTALGTVYSQMLLLGAKESPRTRRLQEDIAEQIASLQDIAEAMDEVYQAQSWKVGRLEG